MRNRKESKISIMYRANTKERIDAELANGDAARRAGLEGRARVCARRAAGIAVREYLELRGISPAGPTAVDVLAQLRDRPEISPDVRQAAEQLLMRVNEGFDLPAQVDLLEVARWVADTLEKRVGE